METSIEFLRKVFCSLIINSVQIKMASELGSKLSSKVFYSLIINKVFCSLVKKY